MDEHREEPGRDPRALARSLPSSGPAHPSSGAPGRAEPVAAGSARNLEARIHLLWYAPRLGVGEAVCRNGLGVPPSGGPWAGAGAQRGLGRPLLLGSSCSRAEARPAKS